MGTLGNSGKYTMVVAENEEESPWEPLHVEHGFDKEDSTVTVSFPNSMIQIWPYGSDDKGILRGVISNVMPGRRGLSLMLIPPHARTLASHGWTEKEIATFISEYARVPSYRHPEYWESWLPEKEHPPIEPEDPVSILRNPDWIRVFVAGGPGNFMGLIMGGISWVTKEAELPRNWAELVKKWEDVVPKYVKY
jgi:hypothetical protein